MTQVIFRQTIHGVKVFDIPGKVFNTNDAPMDAGHIYVYPYGEYAAGYSSTFVVERGETKLIGSNVAEMIDELARKQV